MVQRLLTGWGRTSPSRAELVEFTDASGASADLGRLLANGSRGAVARGLGRSYGDSAQNGGGVALSLVAGPPRADDVVIDVAAATASVAAGVSLDRLLRQAVPAGLFVPVTPGTRFVTVGGAIASDIHGKNHHVDGTFGSHVRAMTLLLASGEVIEVSPSNRPDLFWATVGGMGLTGVILRATFAMIPIETSRCTVDTERVHDIDELMAHMATDDDAFRYSVAWIDLMATGGSLGRSVLTRGDHTRVEELTARQAVDPLAYGPKQLATVPPMPLPGGVLNRASIGAFNQLWFRKAPRRRLGQVLGLTQFFHPLDAVGHWNRLYGRSGFLQYQFTVPFGEEATLRRVVERLSSSGVTSFLAVLKRFGAANPAPLSFPHPGWTLALDIPAAPELARLLSELDHVVLDAGGRHYLSKDGCTTPESIRRGYPRLDEWRAIRDSVDPDHRWASDQSRRLHLTG